MCRLTALAFVIACQLAPQASADVLFSSGPYNGTVDGWDISGASAPVADNFVLSGAATVNGASFVTWANPGDVMTTVDWSILSSPVAGTTYASGTASVSQTLIITPSIFGYDIDNESFSFPDLALSPGTYWLELQNADATTACDPVTTLGCFFWDENDNPNNIPGLQAWDGGIGYLNNTNDPTDCGVGQSCTETFTISGTPEPGSFVLLGSVLLWMAAFIRRRVVR